MRSLTPKEKKAWDAFLEFSLNVHRNTAPKKNETAAEKSTRIKHLTKKGNELEFFKYYFAHYVKAEFGYFHKEAAKELLYGKHNLAALEWPRECAKSVFLNVFISIYELVTDRSTGLILVSENEWKAKILIKDIYVELSKNQLLRSDFGEFRLGGSWLDGYFYTSDGIGFWAFGLGQNPAGTREGHRRPNRAHVDDADNKDVAKNGARTRERVDWINGELLGCLTTGDYKLRYANNRVCEDGLTAHFVGDLEEGDPIREGLWHSKVYWSENPKTREMLSFDQGGISCWPENYSRKDAIARFKDMGYRNGMRQLYHTDIKEGTVFTEVMLPWTSVLPLHLYDALVSYTDPAFGESKKGCYRSVVLVGMKGHDYDIIWAWVRQSGNFAKAQHTLEQRIQDNPHVIIGSGVKFNIRAICEHWTESNELQKQLLKRIYKELNDTLDISFNPRLDMDKKGDKLARIESMETLAEHGHIRFNEAYRKDKDMLQLRKQFLGFPNGFIDGPDAVHGAIKKLDKSKKRRKSGSMRTGKYQKSTSRLG